MPTPNAAAIAGALLLVAAPLLAAPAGAPSRGPQGPTAVSPASIAFRDVSASAGIVDRGISFGASAGDANGDGWPDLFSGGHYGAHPRLWVNQRNGRFLDAVPLMVPPPDGDMHGAQWADLDNDGAQELVLMRGAGFGIGSSPKLAYRLIGAQLVDTSAPMGLNVPPMRARTPIALDYDDDGDLDMFLTALTRTDGLAPPSPYLQATTNAFVEWTNSGFPPTSLTQWGTLGDLDDDLRLDLLLQGFPHRAFRTGPAGLTQINGAIGLPPAPTMTDCVVADFDNDGRNELYMARAPLGSDYHFEDQQRLEFRAIVVGSEHTVRVRVPSPNQLRLDWGPLPWWPLNTVFIGSAGLAPLLGPDQTTTLLSNLPAHQGIAAHTPGQSNGIYIGYDPAAGEWVVSVSTTVWNEAMIRMVSSVPMLMPATTIGFNPSQPQPSDLLAKRVGGAFVDRSLASGIPTTLQGRSVVAADFDNDMDLDLYVVTATPTRNTENVLLSNDGTGRFTPVRALDAGGSTDGVGDCVVTLDYDRDGRVDLFVTNGDAPAFRQGTPSDAFGDNGPSQLLRNETVSGNRWLGIELQGTSSNRDGIGARIEVTAGGRRQVREHGGGMHRYSQNHGIHFGLGPNPTADVLVVWPNGSTSIRRNVPTNQFLRIVQ
jgi:hypothetical protein